jgi:Xaa-Pro dipeptidase
LSPRSRDDASSGSDSSPRRKSAERYEDRQRRLCNYLSAAGLEAAVLVDLEGCRDSSLRYLCGHPQDALLFVFAAGDTLLLPWDLSLAQRHAAVGGMRAFEEYGRSEELAIRSILAEANVKTAELSGKLAFPLVETLKRALSETVLTCRSDGLDLRLREWRAVKDEEEQTALRRACRITDQLLVEVETLLLSHDGRSSGGIREVDLALHLEVKARELGADGMGFETLAAGPERSYAIHCVPAVTAQGFGGRGFSILDFGVVVDGYTSDVTVTAVRSPLSKKQDEMLKAVRGAYELSSALCRPGVEPPEVARAVEEYFQSRSFHMPHALGHGIGLEPHEAPLVRTRKGTDSTIPLTPGMVFTLEPGLYAPGEGGIRLENDFLVTTEGVEVLTSARLIRM